jgi:hypothetical protein
MIIIQYCCSIATVRALYASPISLNPGLLLPAQLQASFLPLPTTHHPALLVTIVTRIQGNRVFWVKFA